MSNYDVIIIGSGAGGLTFTALYCPIQDASRKSFLSAWKRFRQAQPIAFGPIERVRFTGLLRTEAGLHPPIRAKK